MAITYNSLSNAIADFWAAYYLRDDEELVDFARESKDDSFPKEFMGKFLDELEAQNWKKTADPDCKIPKEIMASLLEKEKENLIKESPEEDEAADQVTEADKIPRTAEEKERLDSAIEHAMRVNEYALGKSEFLEKYQFPRRP